MLEVNPHPALFLRKDSTDATALKARFALAMALARSRIVGRVYENEAARVVHGQGGLLIESKPPMKSFFAHFGSLSGTWLPPREATALALGAFERLEAGDEGWGIACYGRGRFRVALHGQCEGRVRPEPPRFLRAEWPKQGLAMIEVQGEYLLFQYPRTRPVLGLVHE